MKRIELLNRGDVTIRVGALPGSQSNTLIRIQALLPVYFPRAELSLINPTPSMATEPMENESMLGVLIVLFLVVVSTIYVFSQQQQQRIQTQGNPQGGGQGFVGGAATAVHQSASAISTTNLTEKQLRLHRSLPSRHGARAITICADAIVKNKTDESAIGWANEDTPSVLADLLQISDVYVLCKIDSDDQQVRARIQQFLTSWVAASTLSKPLKPHKILFCNTSVGKVAFVRQIEPQVHVEVDLSLVRDLEKHVPRIVHIVPSLDKKPDPGMHHVTDSFATYFDLLSAV